jgi:thiol-disulfide isomerase/thioredoxin
MYRKLFYLLLAFLFLGEPIVAQNTFLKVNNGVNELKNVYLLKYENFLTNRYQIVDEFDAKSENKSFSFESIPGPYLLMCDDVYARIYVQPGDSLEVDFTINDSTAVRSFAGNTYAEPYFTCLSQNCLQNEITMVEDFFFKVQIEYEYILEDNKGYKNYLNKVVKAFQKADYSPLSEYAQSYAKYILADFEFVSGVERDKLYENYIKDIPIDFRNDAQTDFLLDFYTLYFNRFKVKWGKDELDAALKNYASIERIKEILAKDDFTRSDKTTELVIMISAMQQSRQDADFRPIAEHLYSELQQKSVHPKTQNLAKELYENANRYKQGADLPPYFSEVIDAVEKPSEPYTIVAFVAPWSTYALRDLTQLKLWQEQYKNFIHVTAVDIEEGKWTDAQKTRLKKLNIPLLDPDYPRQIRVELDILRLPFYLLIDNNGKLIEYDFPGPSEGGEAIIHNMYTKENQKIRNEKRR